MNRLIPGAPQSALGGPVLVPDDQPEGRPADQGEHHRHRQGRLERQEQPGSAHQLSLRPDQPGHGQADPIR